MFASIRQIKPLTLHFSKTQLRYLSIPLLRCFYFIRSLDSHSILSLSMPQIPEP